LQAIRINRSLYHSDSVDATTACLQSRRMIYRMRDIFWLIHGREGTFVLRLTHTRRVSMGSESRQCLGDHDSMESRALQPAETRRLVLASLVFPLNSHTSHGVYEPAVSSNSYSTLIAFLFIYLDTQTSLSPHVIIRLWPLSTRATSSS
jgi:hypothetical protein